MDVPARPLTILPHPDNPALTLFLNGQEIAAAMTVGGYPQDLAVGCLLNQGMLRPDDVIS